MRFEPIFSWSRDIDHSTNCFTVLSLGSLLGGFVSIESLPWKVKRFCISLWNFSVQWFAHLYSGRKLKSCTVVKIVSILYLGASHYHLTNSWPIRCQHIPRRSLVWLTTPWVTQSTTAPPTSFCFYYTKVSRAAFNLLRDSSSLDQSQLPMKQKP